MKLHSRWLLAGALALVGAAVLMPPSPVTVVRMGTCRRAISRRLRAMASPKPGVRYDGNKLECCVPGE